MPEKKRPAKTGLNLPALGNLSRNLRTLMEAKGFKQLELAKYSKEFGGISQKTISNILNQTRGVYLEQLDVLAAVFGITPAQLIADDFEIVRLIPLTLKGPDTKGLPPRIMRAAKQLENLPEAQRESIIGIIEGFSVSAELLRKST
jgi:transcriptional regulator with XRE-family HTH domain